MQQSLARLVLIATVPIALLVAAPSAAMAHSDDEVTFSNGVRCGLSIQSIHYSPNHKDVSLHSTVLCNGSRMITEIHTVILGPGHHGLPVANCRKTYDKPRRIADNVYQAKQPCHSGFYPGDGTYQASVTAQVTVGNETKPLVGSRHSSVMRPS